MACSFNKLQLNLHGFPFQHSHEFSPCSLHQVTSQSNNLIGGIEIERQKEKATFFQIKEQLRNQCVFLVRRKAERQNV
jgi:hypothetical protein